MGCQMTICHVAIHGVTIYGVTIQGVKKVRGHCPKPCCYRFGGAKIDWVKNDFCGSRADLT
jgi:hypothetical protein